MIKWKYHTEEVPDAELVSGILEKRLNKMGKEGWELVTFSMDVSLGANSFAIFKRMEEVAVDVEGQKEVFRGAIVEVVRAALSAGEIDLKQHVEETPFRVGITGEGKEVSKEKVKAKPVVEVRKDEVKPKSSVPKPKIKPSSRKLPKEKKVKVAKEVE